MSLDVLERGNMDKSTDKLEKEEEKVFEKIKDVLDFLREHFQIKPIKSICKRTYSSSNFSKETFCHNFKSVADLKLD